jgi:hypothetical protein
MMTGKEASDSFDAGFDDANFVCEECAKEKNKDEARMLPRGGAVCEECAEKHNYISCDRCDFYFRFNDLQLVCSSCAEGGEMNSPLDETATGEQVKPDDAADSVAAPRIGNCEICDAALYGELAVESEIVDGIGFVSLKEMSERNWILCDACNLLLCRDCCQQPQTGLCNSCFNRMEKDNRVSGVRILLLSGKPPETNRKEPKRAKGEDEKL